MHVICQLKWFVCFYLGAPPGICLPYCNLGFVSHDFGSPPAVCWCYCNFSVAVPSWKSCLCFHPAPRYSVCPTSSKSGETKTSALGSFLKSQNVTCKFHSSLYLSWKKSYSVQFSLDCATLCWEGDEVWQVSAIELPPHYSLPPLGLALAWDAVTSHLVSGILTKEFGLYIVKSLSLWGKGDIGLLVCHLADVTTLWCLRCSDNCILCSKPVVFILFLLLIFLFFFLKCYLSSSELFWVY